MENEEIYYQIKKLYEENEYDKIIKLVLSLEYECLDDDILDIFYNAFRTSCIRRNLSVCG